MDEMDEINKIEEMDKDKVRLSSPSPNLISPLLRSVDQSQATGVMDYVRKLEGIIKTERATFEERVALEVAWRLHGTRLRWIVYGVVLGCLPWLGWMKWG